MFITGYSLTRPLVTACINENITHLYSPLFYRSSTPLFFCTGHYNLADIISKKNVLFTNEISPPIITSIMGLEYISWISPKYHSYPGFDFLLDKNDTLQSGVEIFPRHLADIGVERCLKVSRTEQRMLTIKELIRERTDAPIFILAPPPVSDNTEFYGNIAPNTMKKIYTLLNEKRKALCEKLEYTYIDCPPETMTEDGFLKPEFWLDGFHTNMKYGIYQLAQIRNLGLV